MLKKIYLAVISTLLLLLLIGSPLLKVADSNGILDVRDLGNQTAEGRVYTDTPIDGILNAFSQLKDSLNDIYTNFMPLYYETVTAWNKFEDTLNAPFTTMYSRARANTAVNSQNTESIDSGNLDDQSSESFTPDPEKVVSVTSTLLNTTATHRYYQVDISFEDGKNVSFLDTAVNLNDQQKENRVKSQAALLNNIAGYNDDVNFYFMLLTRMQDTDYFEDIIVGEESTQEYADLFLSLLDPKIVSQKWDIGSVRDRIERVYLTDHHWTTYGSYLGFRQICEMICPDHIPVELGEPIDFPESRFFGSYARICQTMDLWDVFRVYDNDVKATRTMPEWDFDTQVDFLASQQYQSPEHNIYALFYPEINGVRYLENDTGKNLLVIGDSYTQGFAELLGSAFDSTQIYYYTNYSGMKYNSVIERYGITDVLFMQFSDRILFDQYGDCKLSSITGD